MKNETKLIVDGTDLNAGEIAQFTSVTALLTDYSERFGIVHSIDTDDGVALVKEGVKLVGRAVRGIEGARTTLKAPILEAGKLLDAKAKEAKAPFEKLLEPMKTLKKQHDDAEKRREQERLARLDAKIQKMTDCLAGLHSKTPEQIEDMIAWVSAEDTQQDYYDRKDAAIAEQSRVLNELDTALESAIQQQIRGKELAEQQAETARLEAAAKLDQRINNLKQKPADLIDASADEIKVEIDNLTGFEPKDEIFGNRTEEVKGILSDVLSRLNKLHKMALLDEQEQPEPPAAPDTPEGAIESSKTDQMQQARQSDFDEYAGNTPPESEPLELKPTEQLSERDQIVMNAIGWIESTCPVSNLDELSKHINALYDGGFLAAGCGGEIC